jgi:hypothetical protein
MIGGALAKPVESLPSVFAPGSIWDRFPYLLPNLFSAICVSVGVVIGILFLEETHAEKKLCRDGGRELGDHLLSLLPGRSEKSKGNLPASDAEQQPLLMETDSLPEYLTGKASPGRSSTSGSSQEELTDTEEAKPVTGIFTKPVLTIIASYGILAL